MRASGSVKRGEASGSKRAELMRSHNVTALTVAELEQARRELAASLALARPGAPSAVPTLAHLDAIDAELAERSVNSTTIHRPAESMTYLCSCGFGTSDPEWLDGAPVQPSWPP
jgi:hypothetical protein